MAAFTERRHSFSFRLRRAVIFGSRSTIPPFADCHDC
jgi:hypothetical protein